MRVAFLGEIGSYSEGAATEYFGAALERVPCETFAAIFAAVTHGEAEQAIVPIENTLAGSLHSNYDLLLRHELHIVGEWEYWVQHQLLALPGVALPEIRLVCSHPQALEQCDRFLTTLGVIREVMPDTTAAARRVRAANRRDTAAIASDRAAAVYGLAPLATGVEDSAENYTRFLILARAPLAPPADRPVRTSLVFSLDNVPGSLQAALAVFARRGINLTKIESRPLRGRRWEYLFYLDFAAGQADAAAVGALQELGGMAPFLRVLGSYPQSRKARLE